MKWLERTWQFPINGIEYLVLIQKLKNTASIIIELTHGLQEEQTKRKVNNKWSINEHAGHLLTIESLWIARLDDFVMGHSALRPWNGTNADTDAANFNRQRLGKILEDFDDIRTVHAEMLSKFEDKCSEMQARIERLNTTMNLRDHIWFMTEHDEHHINAIQQLIQETHAD